MYTLRVSNEFSEVNYFIGDRYAVCYPRQKEYKMHIMDGQHISFSDINKNNPPSCFVSWYDIDSKTNEMRTIAVSSSSDAYVMINSKTLSKLRWELDEDEYELAVSYITEYEKQRKEYRENLTLDNA